MLHRGSFSEYRPRPNEQVHRKLSNRISQAPSVYLMSVEHRHVQKETRQSNQVQIQIKTELT